MTYHLALNAYMDLQDAAEREAIERDIFYCGRKWRMRRNPIFLRARWKLMYITLLAYLVEDVQHRINRMGFLAAKASEIIDIDHGRARHLVTARDKLTAFWGLPPRHPAEYVEDDGDFPLFWTGWMGLPYHVRRRFLRGIRERTECLPDRVLSAEFTMEEYRVK